MGPRPILENNASNANEDTQSPEPLHCKIEYDLSKSPDLFL